MRLASSIAIVCLAITLADPLLAQPVARADPAGRSAAESGLGWRDPARWRELRVGMSQAQVIAILGEPGRVTTYYAFERWEYPDALGHRVNFDDKGRLLVWGPLAR